MHLSLLYYIAAISHLFLFCFSPLRMSNEHYSWGNTRTKLTICRTILLNLRGRFSQLLLFIDVFHLILLWFFCFFLCLYFIFYSRYNGNAENFFLMTNTQCNDLLIWLFGKFSIFRIETFHYEAIEIFLSSASTNNWWENLNFHSLIEWIPMFVKCK